MLLPNRDHAYIPASKLIDYLLPETHAVGKSKARFFRALGFDETDASLLERALLTIGKTETIIETVQSPFGIKYVVDGALETPNGAFVRVRTVWVVETEDTRPRFVTAYPTWENNEG